MKRLVLNDAVVTLSREECEVVKGELRVKSDGRVIYRNAKSLIEAGMITESGEVTAFLRDRIELGCLHFLKDH